uniref:Myb/SANT-like domain-containing protein n=1 Tax=Cucumis melo TaxID=3656 RepID=A0A9I9EHF1_CUCME
MSQKSIEQLCIDDIVEIDGLKSEGPWSNKSEAFFVDLMDEEVAKGNRLTTTFTKTSWNYMKSQLNASTINLEEEQWNELFKVNKRAKKFRKSGCPHHEKLVRIFGDTTATGVNACPSKDLFQFLKMKMKMMLQATQTLVLKRMIKEKAKK